jgi:molybdopterin molybdotransferase
MPIAAARPRGDRGLVTLAVPLLHRLLGREQPPRRHVTLRADMPSHDHDAWLVPVGDDVPQFFGGPVMLRGLALSGDLAVVPPGGARAGDTVELIGL